MQRSLIEMLSPIAKPPPPPPTYKTEYISSNLIGDADGIHIKINASRNDQLQCIAPSVALFIGTADSLQVIPAQSTANNVQASVVNSSGSDAVQGRLVEGGCVFSQRFGRRIGQIGWQGVYNPRVPPDDLTFYATHLFDTQRVTLWDFQQHPRVNLWFLREDGSIVALLMDTYHKVRGWWRVQTDGVVTSVAVIPGDNRDVLAISVTRNGFNLIEILDDPDWYDPSSINGGQANANYLDSALTKSSGTAFTSVTGLDHLEGKVVGMVGDGAYLGTATVASGSVTLPTASKIAHVGLPFTATMQSMPIENGNEQTSTVGLSKSVVLANIRFYNTLDCEVGPDTTNMKSAELGGVNVALANPTLFSGDEQVSVPNEPRSPAYLVIRSSKPLPCTVSAIQAMLSVGAAE